MNRRLDRFIAGIVRFNKPAPVAPAAVALLAVACIGLGAVIYDIALKARAPLQTVNFSYLYYSESHGERAFSIDDKGKIDFGPNYDRETEARHLLEMFRMLKNGGITTDCHETGYRPPPRLGGLSIWLAPADGVLRVFPGQALPPPPRSEWRF